MKYNIQSTHGQVLGTIELADGLEVVAEATAPPAPPQPPRMEEVKTMTEAAGQFTYEQYQEMGWSDNALVANGLMKVEMHRVEPQEPGQLHPSVEHQQLGQDWQPEPPQATPEPPAPPQAPPPLPQATPEPPAAPGVPPVPQPDAPAAPGAPTPPSAPQPEQQAPQTQSAGDLPEGLSRVDGAVPKVEGREFILRGVSYENVVDKEGVLFDGRIHGVTSDNVPSTKKDGTFKKKRNLDAAEFEHIQGELRAALNGGAHPTGPAPTPPAAPGAPSVPNVPQSSAPQTAPPPPANMDALQDALKDWGEEI